MNNIDFEKLKNEGIEWSKSICRPKLNSFDEWCSSQIIMIKSEARAAYTAGAQSRQAEVDELKKRIDEALVQISNHYHSCITRKSLKRMSASVSEIAEIEAHESNMSVLENTLKGNQND